MAKTEEGAVLEANGHAEGSVIPAPLYEPLSDTEADLEEVARLGLNVIREFLKTGDESPSAYQRAKIAQATVGNWTRNKQTRSAIAATRFMMARELATNRDELKRYMALTAPAALTTGQG